MIIAAVLYWLRIPRIDFAVSFATLWLITTMVIEIISPKPLCRRWSCLSRSRRR